LRFLAIATDFDGTLALNGHVKQETISGLIRARNAGFKLILITGRELPELLNVFSRLDLFDLVVAENGALLFCPQTGMEKMLCDSPSEEFISALRKEQVSPLSVGRCVVAAVRPFDIQAQKLINRMSMGHHIIFNRESVMILPAGTDKASGLRHATNQLQIPLSTVVGIGDAENDAPFLAECGMSVAVSNAIQTLKDQVDIVTTRSAGAGVVECITSLLAPDDSGPDSLPFSARL
jgi:hydroxymethylpyrimidine pyrophosphatase-like HAD family hydrolase